MFRMSLTTGKIFLIATVVISTIFFSCKQRTNSRLSSASEKEDLSSVSSKIRSNLSGASPVQSVEQFLNLPFILPMFVNTILMVESGSTQPASNTAPRAILQSNDATFMASFTGSSLDMQSFKGAESPDTNRIEIIEFDSAKDIYRFFEIDFSRPVRELQELTNEKEGCQSCHHGAPKWDPYDFWPGAMPKAGACKNDLEKRFFSEFHQAKIGHPRYGLIPDFDCPSNNIKFADRLRNNFHFDWIARKIQKSPNYQSLKYAIVGSLLYCPKSVSTLYGDEEPCVSSSTYTKSAWENTLSDTLKQFAKMDKDIVKLVADSGGNLQADVSARMRYILRTQGFPMEGLFMSTQNDYFISALPVRFAAIANALIKQDPELASLGIVQLFKDNHVQYFGVQDGKYLRKYVRDVEDTEYRSILTTNFSDYLNYAFKNEPSNVAEKFPEQNKICDILVEYTKAKYCQSSRASDEIRLFEKSIKTYQDR